MDWIGFTGAECLFVEESVIRHLGVFACLEGVTFGLVELWMITRIRREGDLSYFIQNLDCRVVNSCVSSLQRGIRIRSLTRDAVYWPKHITCSTASALLLQMVSDHTQVLLPLMHIPNPT